MSDQIDVNQLSNALQQKVDLPAGKSQADIDYVVESQAPTADNNYTWYRKYKSGWIEQGGIWTGDITIQSGHENYATITLPCTMNSTNYTVILSGAKNYCLSTGSNNRTTTQFRAIFVSYTETRHLTEFTWLVHGFINNE